MKLVAFVPIKLENQRLKNKNILDLNGKPLCYYIFKNLLSVNLNTYVFCSNESILDFLPKGVIFIKRDEKLDNENTLGIEIYKSFIEKVDSSHYLLAHATSPFTKKETINQVVEKLNYHDSCFTVKKIQNFTWYKNKTLNYELNHIPRTQDMEPLYVETSALYGFKKELIFENKRIGCNYSMVEVDSIESIDIDTLDEYELAKKLEKNLN